MRFNKKNIKYILIIIFIISFLVRLSYGIGMFQKNGTSEFCDDWDFISYAININSQGIFVPDISKLRDDRDVPGYPLIIALLFKVFGENYIFPIILNAIISSLIPLIVFFLARKIYGLKVAFLSFIWSSIYLLHIRYIPRILKEEFVYFLLPLIVYLIIKDLLRLKLSYKILLTPILFTLFIHIDGRYFFLFSISWIKLSFFTKE